MEYNNFYDEVYKHDNSNKEPHGWIQWKGTDVCIDLHCECGYHGHFDGDFFYFYECPNCHKKYAVGQVIKLIPLTDKQVKFVEEDRPNLLHTCELDE